jgi:hypothetical protein
MMNTRDQGRRWLAPDHPSLTYTAHVHIDRDATLREPRRHSGFATSTTPAFARAPLGCSPSMPGTKPKTSPHTSSVESRKKSMANAKRDIGQEILDGILELRARRNGPRYRDSFRCGHSRGHGAFAGAFRSTTRGVGAHLAGMGTGAPRTFGCSTDAAADCQSQSKGASRSGSGFDRPRLSNPQGVTKSTVGK